MQRIAMQAILVGMALLPFAAATAFGETATVRILNDGADEIVASVYDLNAQSSAPALINLRIEGFAWVPVVVTTDASGSIRLRWTAETVDADFRRCGHRTKHFAASDAVVLITADSRCSKNPS
jgi:hypothetical protein